LRRGLYTCSLRFGRSQGNRARHAVSKHPSKLDQLRRYALSLPEVTEQPHFDYSSFRVRGKIFVTVPPGGQHLNVFVDEEQRELALAVHAAFVEKLWWGGKVVGLRNEFLGHVPMALLLPIRLALEHPDFVGLFANALLQPRLSHLGIVVARITIAMSIDFRSGSCRFACLQERG